MIWEVLINLLYWVLAIAGIVASGLYAGLEIGIYSLNRVRLHTLAQRGDKRARMLLAMLHKPGQLIIVLLIATNLATNVATSFTGLLLHRAQLLDWQVLILDVLILTPVLMIFAEVLPKDLFSAHADTLVYALAGFLRQTRRLLSWTGAPFLVNYLTEVVMRMFGASDTAAAQLPPRRQVGMLLKEGSASGLVSEEQSAIIERVLDLTGRIVRDEMTPWSKVVSMKLTDPPGLVWNLAEESPHTRFVVLDGEKPVGIVSIYDALVYERQACPAISQLMQRAITVAPSTPLQQALAKLQGHHLAIAIVMEEDKPVGIVTVKDLLEPITGELTNW